jgi:Tfp pilus assembly protein PilN
MSFGSSANHAFESFDDLEDVVNQFGKYKPYHIHVLGTGVLSRKIESSSAYQQDLIMNGNPNEFLFTNFDDGNNMAVSFCRKSLISDYLKQFEEEKWQLYGLSCGYSPICGILENETVSTEFEIEVKGDKIASFKRSETAKDKSNWRSDFWTTKSLISEAIRINKTTENKWIVDGEENGETNRENIHQYNQFKTMGIGIVGVILLALIVNYFYQNHLNDEVAQLEMDLSVHTENISMLDRLSQEKQRKEQLIGSAGVNASSFLSYYMDEIGVSVPKSITLSDMTVFPVVGKLKEKQRIEVDQKRIWIAGITKDNEILDNWIEKMDRFGWIKSIELLNYLKSTDDWAEFELQITLSE